MTQDEAMTQTEPTTSYLDRLVAFARMLIMVMGGNPHPLARFYAMALCRDVGDEVGEA